MHGSPIASLSPLGETRSQRNKRLNLKPKRSGHEAVVKLDKFEAFIADRLGPDASDEAVAKFLKLGFGTVRRVRTEGKLRVSHPFMSALGKKLPASEPLQQYFELGFAGTGDLAQDAA